MDLITLNRIKLLHPKVRAEAFEAYKHANNQLLGKNVRLRFAYTLRTFEEQEELYAIGRTKFFDKNGKRLGMVTKARGGQSIHNYGLGIDIVLLIDKNSDNNYETASWNLLADSDKDGTPDWMEVINYFKSLGWSWGGDWKSFPDYPHLEKTFGLSWKELLKRYNNNEVFTEIIDGKLFKWVNL